VPKKHINDTTTVMFPHSASSKPGNWWKIQGSPWTIKLY